MGRGLGRQGRRRGDDKVVEEGSVHGTTSRGVTPVAKDGVSSTRLRDPLGGVDVKGGSPETSQGIWWQTSDLGFRDPSLSRGSGLSTPFFVVHLTGDHVSVRTRLNPFSVLHINVTAGDYRGFVVDLVRW